MGTIITLLILTGLTVGSAIRMIKKKKAGQSLHCGCCSSSCCNSACPKRR